MKTKFLIAAMVVAVGVGACTSKSREGETGRVDVDTTIIDSASTDSSAVTDTTNRNMQDSLGNAKNPRP